MAMTDRQMDGRTDGHKTTAYTVYFNGVIVVVVVVVKSLRACWTHENYRIAV